MNLLVNGIKSKKKARHKPSCQWTTIKKKKNRQLNTKDSVGKTNSTKNIYCTIKSHDDLNVNFFFSRIGIRNWNWNFRQNSHCFWNEQFINRIVNMMELSDFLKTSHTYTYIFYVHFRFLYHIKSGMNVDFIIMGMGWILKHCVKENVQ